MGGLARFLKYINWLIAFLLFSLLVGIYWYVYRALPQTTGTAAAPVSAPVTIARDARGVPHIRAANDDDLFFAQGYVTAQDRLFQLEFTRRHGAGELAELFGARAVESDVDARRFRMRRLAEVYANRLPDEDRPPMTAYARGVNYFIQTHSSTLPVEFRALKFDPAPWSLRDSMLTALEMYKPMTQSWHREMIAFDLLSHGADSAKVAMLYPTRTGLEPLLGSNAWVVSGKHTKSGKPLLASDPHLRLTLPSVWYQIHLQAPGINVAGVSLPGLPGVGIGHNDRIAWGITNSGFDVQDLYAFPANIGPLPLEQEVIRIRDAKPLNVRVAITPRGPIYRSENGRAFALRWIAMELGRMDYPMVEVNKARDWQQFRKALSRFPGPAFNFAYGDIDGNIGYQLAGRLPIREQGAGIWPQDGLSTPPNDWKGIIPFDDLPSVFNPSSGRIVTANQNPFPQDYKYPVAGEFAAHYRATQIESRLKARTDWDADGFRSIQDDNYSSFDRFVAQQVARAAKGRTDHPQMSVAVQLLEAWDGQMRAERPEPLLAELTFSNFRAALVASIAPARPGSYRDPVSYWVVERFLRERPAGFLPNYDQALVAALTKTLAEGTATYGRSVADWRYGQWNHITLGHPIASGLPLVNSFFRIDAGLSGGVATPNQNVEGKGPSMRMVADLSSWDKSTLILPTGQSGLLLSSHFKDQWPTYSAGKTYPMSFDKVEASDTLTLLPLAK